MENNEKSLLLEFKKHTRDNFYNYRDSLEFWSTGHENLFEGRGRELEKFIPKWEKKGILKSRVIRGIIANNWKTGKPCNYRYNKKIYRFVDIDNS